MPVTEAEVRRIAQLARLRLTDEEVVLYQGQFSQILDLVSEISGLDTSAVAATASVAAAGSGLREDVPESFPDTERLLALAPERAGDYYKVKRVLE
ncbi:MAG: Asp-tRNA(Asn)/Glu-tRNA(Gln) amidotransferase subunit GatC [Elusimicrobiota bacterium]|jgi:aspartyl-tRNA(Asn)/glutamyl-tRNA(Gln) amidotransferase subunit C